MPSNRSSSPHPSNNNSNNNNNNSNNLSDGSPSTTDANWISKKRSQSEAHLTQPPQQTQTKTHRLPRLSFLSPRLPFSSGISNSGDDSPSSSSMMLPSPSFVLYRSTHGATPRVPLSPTANNNNNNNNNSNNGNNMNRNSTNNSSSSSSAAINKSYEVKNYDFSFESMWNNQQDTSMKLQFKNYLELTFNLEPMLFLEKITEFERMNSSNNSNGNVPYSFEEKYKCAKSICNTFIKTESDMELNIANVMREETLRKVKACKTSNTVSSSLFDSVYFAVFLGLKEGVFPRFLDHATFQRFFQEKMSYSGATEGGLLSQEEFMRVYQIRPKHADSSSSSTSMDSMMSVMMMNNGGSGNGDENEEDYDEEEDEESSITNTNTTTGSPTTTSGGGGSFLLQAHMKNIESQRTRDSSPSLQQTAPMSLFEILQELHSDTATEDYDTKLVINKHDPYFKQEDFESMKKQITDSSLWKLLDGATKKRDSEIYKSKFMFQYTEDEKRERSFPKFKETCLIPFDMDEVFHSFIDQQYVHQCDSTLKEMKFIEYNSRIIHNTRRLVSTVTHNVYMLPFPFKSRDCVLATSVVKDMDSYLILKKSVELESVPAKSSCKRATMLCGVLIERVFANVTRFSVCTFVDMKGTITPPILEAIFTQRNSQYKTGITGTCLARRERLGSPDTDTVPPPQESFHILDTMADNDLNLNAPASSPLVIIE